VKEQICLVCKFCIFNLETCAVICMRDETEVDGEGCDMFVHEGGER